MRARSLTTDSFVRWMQAVVLAATFLAASCAQALTPPFPPPSPGGLFSSFQIMEAKVKAPFQNLYAMKKNRPVDVKKSTVRGELSYKNEQGQWKTVEVDIHMKGFSTLAMCPFPKLEMKVVSPVAGTIFSQSQTFDLNTHCSEPGDINVFPVFRAGYYNHREALAYRMLEILQIPTYRARPAKIQYEDTTSPSPPQFMPRVSYQAFFLEDLSSFKKRVQVQEIKDSKDPFRMFAPPAKLSQYQFRSVHEALNMDREDVGRVELFQKLIGNADWFIRKDANDVRSEETPNGLWNMKVVSNARNQWIPFPQDFSLSGLVTAEPYAPSTLKVFSELTADSKLKIKRQFLDRKSALYDSLSFLEEDNLARNNTRFMLDRFFSELENLP